MDTSVRMISLLSSLETTEFREKPADASGLVIDIALEKGWIEGHKSRPALRIPDQLRLTARGEKVIDIYLK